MKDEAEQTALELLPCEKLTRLCNPELEELCYGCQLRPAVAAALREAQQDGYIKGWTAGNEHEDALDAEIAKLKEALAGK